MPEWEVITKSTPTGTYDRTERLVVPGGWLYHRKQYVENGYAIAMVFVPNPNEVVINPTVRYNTDG